MKKAFFRTTVILFFTLTSSVVEINNANADPVFCGWYCPGNNYADMTTMTGCRVREEWRCNNVPQVTTTVVSGRTTSICESYDWSYTCPCNYLGCAEYSARTCTRRDRRGSCIAWREPECIRCNSNGGESPCSPVGRYVPNTGTICSTGCLRISGIVAGTGTWSVCQPSGGTYKQYMTGTPIWQTVSGSTCSDIVAPVRPCGACNPAAVSTPTSITPVNRCLSGGSTVPTILGNQWIWQCNGPAPDALDDASCNAPYIPVPIITLNATPASFGNLNNGSNAIVPRNTNLDWSISNYAAACGAGGCTCTLSLAGTGNIATYDYLTKSEQDVLISTGGNHNFTVTCNNTNGGSGSVGPVNIPASCSIVNWEDGCNVECGDGQNPTHTMQTNCSVTNSYPSCTMPPCPITSEWKEVRP